MKVHHIGYLVKNINESVGKFLMLGYQASEIKRNEDRGIDICFIKNGAYSLELVSPFSEESDVSDIIKRHPNCGYHICYETEDILGDLDILKKEGFISISNITSAPSIKNSDVVFLYHSAIGLVELVKFGEEK